MMLGLCTRHWPFFLFDDLGLRGHIIVYFIFEIFSSIFSHNFFKCAKHMWQIPCDPKSKMSEKKKHTVLFVVVRVKGKKSWSCKRIFCQHKDLSFSSFFFGQSFSLAHRHLELFFYNQIEFSGFFCECEQFSFEIHPNAMGVRKVLGLSIVFSFFGIKIGD